MTDIVEKLRLMLKSGEYDLEDTRILKEAVQEIESLRAALAKVAASKASDGQ